ncbi:hypothetical protein PsorP6_002351 [Peronosclerospora sorghi]|uniref:Uncharacterized protein n=1 Tax=Peronosclerospora sorghi TaxID=230839 RepID=A0ACC0WWL1_9STRA|nr:hypothetical protein PsorP6_002351 [Peronosclerospora sorghi]
MFAKKYLNEEHSSVNEICHLFINEAKLNQVPMACVLACADPVLNNTVNFTNIAFGWKIDGASLEKELGINQIEHHNEIKAKLGCRKRFSVERIVSGPGLATNYEFLDRKFPEKVDPKVHEEFLKADTQQGKVVGENAKTNEITCLVVDFYITGGVAPKNLDYFTQKDIFLDSLFGKGRVSTALRACPIYLVLTEELGEHGAYFYAFPLLQSGA